MGVFPYLVWQTAPLLWICFIPSDSSVRYELHVEVTPERGLPRTQLFVHQTPGWDTLFLPPSATYRLNLRVLKGALLREVFRVDTLLQGMQSPQDLPDPLPWWDDQPACPPEQATGIRVAGPPEKPLNVTFLTPWGDTLEAFSLILADGDTVLPRPDHAVFHVQVEGSGRRKGHGIFHLRPPDLLDLLTSREAEEVVRLFGDDRTAERFSSLDADARRALLDSLLAPFDPDPATPRNEFMDTLKTRIRMARERFREGLKWGLETDRGRVFVRYGPPREVEETVDPLTRQVLLIWHYPEEGVAAVFVKVDWTTYVLLEIRPE